MSFAYKMVILYIFRPFNSLHTTRHRIIYMLIFGTLSEDVFIAIAGGIPHILMVSITDQIAHKIVNSKYIIGTIELNRTTFFCFSHYWSGLHLAIVLAVLSCVCLC